MNITTVRKAANKRGFRFDGLKKWLNNTVGYGYCIYTYRGQILQADTLQGLYSLILKYPELKEGENA